MTQHLILLCADEEDHAGERDSAIAVFYELAQRQPNIECHVFKATGRITDQPIMPIAARNLPWRKADYACIPAWSVDALPDLQNATVIGIGHAARQALFDTLQRLPDARGVYVTHLIDNAATLRNLAARRITVFAPLARDDLQALDRDAATQLDFHPINAVPHTHTPDFVALDVAQFQHTDHAARALPWLHNKTPFAVAVVNAGFELDDHAGRHHTYTMAEAEAHGTALGKHLPQGTKLYALEGGPRNAKDAAMVGDTVLAFTNAYAAANGIGGSDIVIDRFLPLAPYNAIRVGYHLAKDPSCLAFICNAEGYGTMDGACLNVGNTRDGFLFGAFPFAALDADRTGLMQKMLQHYHRDGMALLHVAPDGTLQIIKHPQAVRTPLQKSNPVQDILHFLNLKDNH